MNDNGSKVFPSLNEKQIYVKPHFLNGGIRLYLFVASLLLLSYFTAFYYIEHPWSIGSIVLVFGIVVFGFYNAGFTVYSFVFASIALLPNLNSYIPVGGSFFLTWVESFMVVSIFFFLKKSIIISKIFLLSVSLLLSCVFSLIGSALGLLTVGALLRFGVLLIFISFLLSQRKDPMLFKSFFSGILLIPFTACATYAGEGVLVDMFSANLIEFSRAIYSFQYPIWFSIIIPFLIYLKAPKLFLWVSILFIALLFVLSFARSIIVGISIAGLFYLFFYKDKKPMLRMISKITIFVVFIIVIYFVTFVLNFLEFTSKESGSNETRYEKMAYAFNQFKLHPFFGVGFGAHDEKDIAEKKSIVRAFKVLISPEFGPLTALSEIGAVGSFFLFYLIFLFFSYTIKSLKDRQILPVYKIVILISLGAFISSFLNSNSLSSLIVYLFLCVPILVYKNKNECGDFLYNTKVAL